MDVKIENTIKSIFTDGDEGKVISFFNLPLEFKHVSLEVYRSWETVYFEVQPNENDYENSPYTRISIENGNLFVVQSGNASYSLKFTDLEVRRLETMLDDDDYKTIDIYMKCKNTYGEKVDIGICIDLMREDSVRSC